MYVLEFTNTREIIPALRSELELNGLEFEASGGNATGKKRICKELLGVTLRILDWSDRETMMKENGLNTLFADYDFKDRISPSPVNPGKAVKFDTTGALKPYLRSEGVHLYPEGLLKVNQELIEKEDDRLFLDYTYSERMWYQYKSIIETLRDNGGTRQAFLSIWEPLIDVYHLEKKRVPCSIGYQFFIREGKLNMLYLMRSLEVSNCMGNDIYTSSKLLEYIAEKVGVDCGFLQIFASSLHIFF